MSSDIYLNKGNFLLKMVFVTTRDAARFIGSYSQILTPRHPQELRKAGLFLCKLVEDEIESTKPARESEFAKKLFPEQFPLPPPPENLLAAEYFYGSCLAALTENDSPKKNKYWAMGKEMEQQMSEQIIRKPRVDEICIAALRSANVNYFAAAANFLYPQLPTRECHEAAIKFYNREAMIRYQRLRKLFNFFSFPEVTSRHLQFSEELNEAKNGSATKNIRQKIQEFQKVRELTRREPEITTDLQKVESAQYSGMIFVIYALRGFIPLNKETYHRALPTLKAWEKHLRKEIINDYVLHKNHMIQHQEVLLGLMRCYALQGNYKGVIKTANELHNIESAHQITPALIASAHRIELEAQQNKKYFGRCLPFVPQAPESVAQMIKSFISSYESSQNKLFLNSIYGSKEVGRRVDYMVLDAA